MPMVQGLISLEHWPNKDQAPPPEPDGFLYIDDAVAQVQQSLRLSEESAFNTVWGKVADGSIRFWVKRLSRWTILTKGKIPEPTEIDPNEFRKSKHSGIYVHGSSRELYRILLSADDFLPWMADPDAPARSDRSVRPGDVSQPSKTPPNPNARKRGPQGKAVAVAHQIEADITAGKHTLQYFTEKGMKLEAIATEYDCARSTLAKALELYRKK